MSERNSGGIRLTGEMVPQGPDQGGDLPALRARECPLNLVHTCSGPARVRFQDFDVPRLRLRTHPSLDTSPLRNRGDSAIAQRVFPELMNMFH